MAAQVAVGTCAAAGHDGPGGMSRPARSQTRARRAAARRSSARSRPLHGARWTARADHHLIVLDVWLRRHGGALHPDVPCNHSSFRSESLSLSCSFVHLAPLLQMRLRRVEPAAQWRSLFRSVNANVKSEVANNGRLHCRVFGREILMRLEPHVLDRRAIRHRHSALGKSDPTGSLDATAQDSTPMATPENATPMAAAQAATPMAAASKPRRWRRRQWRRSMCR